MPRWLVWTLVGSGSVPTVVALRAGGDTSLAGPSAWAQVLAVGAGLLLVAAAASAGDDRILRPRLLAAGAGAWLAAEWANPAAPGAVIFTAGLIAGGLALPLVLAATLPRTGAPRALAPAALALAAGGWALQGPLTALAADPRTAGCPDCPHNAVAIASDPALAEALARHGSRLALAACAAALLAHGIGMLRASPTARRRLVALALPGAAFAAATAVELWLTLRGGLAAQGVRAAHLAAAGALVALALGIWARSLLLRRARRAVASATTEIADAGGDALAGALARLLRDPSVALAYSVPDVGWVDAGGHPLELPAARSGRSATVIQDEGEPLAALIHDSGADLDEDLLAQAVAAGRLRLDAERLQAVVLARVEELRRARRRVVDAAEDERRRLERDLHDGAQQRLVALRFTLGLTHARAERAGSLPVVTQVAAADGALQRSLEALRELAHGLYPPSLDADGLATAVRTATERSGVAVAVGPLPAGRLPEALERTAYRVVVDTLAGAERGGARAVRVEAAGAAGRIVVRVEHDARDEDPDGAALLDDRVGALGGSLSVERTSAGTTLVVAELPCA